MRRVNAFTLIEFARGDRHPYVGEGEKPRQEVTGDVMRSLTIITLCLTGLMMGCSQNVQRFGSVIGVKEEALEKYRRMHAEPWPEVNAQLKDANIQNYSIYLAQWPDGNHYLFGYFEYVGDDFDSDMKKMAGNPKIKEWWSHTDPMQIPLSNKKEDEWWKNMEEVYHLD